MDILPHLLLPLAGPDDFPEDVMSCFPDDLQYLEADKKREEDPDIRKMLVEAINKVGICLYCKKFSDLELTINDSERITRLFAFSGSYID